MALLVNVLGAAGALLIASRTWQTIITPRPTPLPDVATSVSGRTVDAAPTALALVALAGVVAVLATKGVARRAVGAVLLLAGAALVWRALSAAAAVSASRAAAIVRAQHASVTGSGAAPRVATSAAWPALTVVCGVLVAIAGALVAWRGAAWQAMSARYERPADPQRDTSRASTALWSALDRGEDPTG